MDVRFAVADLVHQHVVDEDEHCLERPALQLPFLAEVEHVRPEAADPLGVGLAEIEGVADAAVLRFQALHQAARQVIDGDVRLDEHEPHVDERQHAAVALGQWIETQPEQLRTGRAAGLRLGIAQFGIEVVDEGGLDFRSFAGQQAAAGGNEDSGCPEQ